MHELGLHSNNANKNHYEINKVTKLSIKTVVLMQRHYYTLRTPKEVWGLNIHIYIYLLTSWSRVPLEKLTGFAASQEIPRLFGTRKFFNAFYINIYIYIHTYKGQN
jgi:hypothetical protein